VRTWINRARVMVIISCGSCGMCPGSDNRITAPHVVPRGSDPCRRLSRRRGPSRRQCAYARVPLAAEAGGGRFSACCTAPRDARRSSRDWELTPCVRDPSFLTRAMAPVRLCIVGCGVIVDSHLLAIAAASPAEFVVTALVDPNAEAREKIAARVVAELGTETPAQFASLTDALIADPDALMFEAVDLLVPSVGTLHEDISIEAMRAGRHVLLEKPVAVSMDSATRILAASEELMASKVFMVAENSQYISEIVAAQNLIREGAIGCVSSCE